MRLSNYRLSLNALLAFAILVGLGTVARYGFFELPPAPFSAIEGEKECPIDIDPTLMNIIKGSHHPNEWEMFSYGGRAPTPVIDVTPSVAVVDGVERPACALTFVNVPTVPGKGADWRLGHVIQNVEGMSEQTTTFRILVRGSQKFTLNRGSLYIYDGSTVTGTAITEIGTAWKEIIVAKNLRKGARRVEFWIRLVFDDGVVIPNEGMITFVARAGLSQ